VAVAKSKGRRALVLTIGTGDVDRREETLFEPLRKSMKTEKWDKILFLPSQMTTDAATQLKDAQPDLPIVVNALSEAGDEDNADTCFRRFDEALRCLRQEGFQPTDIVIDYTRATKAMSAALVLAGVRHGIPRLRYIIGERDAHGMVKPGSEIVSEVHTAIVTGRRQLDRGRDLMRQGLFAAVAAILPNPPAESDDSWPSELRAEADALARAATFYAAWDRLDYAGALCSAESLEDTALEHIKGLLPSAEMIEWACKLGNAVPASGGPEYCANMAARVRLLAADLLANGERRIRQGHHEDAIIRAYRVLEMIGQFRLFDRNLDSGALPATDEWIKKFQDKLVKKGRAPLGSNRDGTLNAARQNVARLLLFLGDEFAKNLLCFDRDDPAGSPQLKPNVRNNSILIHGFKGVGPDDRKPLDRLFQRLADLLIEAGGRDMKNHIKTARKLDLSNA